MGNLSTSSWEGYLFLIDNTQLPAFVLVFFPAEMLGVHKNNGARNKPHSLIFSSIFLFSFMSFRERLPGGLLLPALTGPFASSRAPI